MRFSIVSIFKAITQVIEKNVFCSYDTVDPTEYLSYSKLNKCQKDSVKEMAYERFEKYAPKNWYSVFNCYNKGLKVNHKEINTSAGFIAEYISENAHGCYDIFKTDKKCDNFLSKVENLTYGGFFMTCLYTPIENATILKKYIKDSLNGIITDDIADIICSTYKNETKENFKELISWFPFILDFNEFMFFNKLIKMFKEIDRNFSDTQMTFNSMIDVFTPLLFPKEIYLRFLDLNFKELTEIIFSLDFNRVPIKIVR